MKKFIIVGAGWGGAEAIINIGRENIAYYYDNFVTGIFHGVPPISLDELIKEHINYEVVVTPVSRNSLYELSYQLKRYGIRYRPYRCEYQIPPMTSHIYGKFPYIKFETNLKDMGVSKGRISITHDMFRKMFETYSNELITKDVDIWIYHGDDCMEAYETAVVLGRRTIFAYSSMYAVKDVVIPIPDYRTCYDDNEYNYEETPELCKTIAEQRWEDERAVWVGNPETNSMRKALKILGDHHADCLKINSYIYHKPSLARNDGTIDNQFMPMSGLGKYKYLIDIRGMGWTDRVKILLRLGRPLLLVDRPYKEWYFDRMKPMEHYVPIKEDLSDLISMIERLNDNPQLYNLIVERTKEFVNEVLNPTASLQYLKDIVLTHGLQ